MINEVNEGVEEDLDKIEDNEEFEKIEETNCSDKNRKNDSKFINRRRSKSNV